MNSCSSSVTNHKWSYFNFKGPRTNNFVEGWHSRLNKVVGKPHPNIYEIIDIFAKMKNVDAGSSRPQDKDE